MTEDSKGDSQNGVACSSPSLTEETARILASPSLANSLPAPHLPFDLVAEILCRLSVKHLVRLRCVRKSWNSLISGDSKFAKKHLSLSTSNHERRHLILTPCWSPKELVLYHSPISSIFSSASTTSIKQFSYSIRDILIKGGYGANGASICDGMVCFKIDNSSALLCNPSIRKFKILPPIIFPDQNSVQILYTLVHDRFTNNYKVIALNLLSKKEVSVHTLGTDYWRRIPDFPSSNLTLMPRGIFVNDSVNWLTYDSASCSRLIVSLDLEKENYQKLSLPGFDVQSATSFMNLGTLRGCLSFLYQRDKFSDVWIMKEHGNEKSWTKLFSVPHMEECVFYGALYISKDDQVLMEFLNEKYNLVVYDSINNTLRIPKFQNSTHCEMVANGVYVESLISPL